MKRVGIIGGETHIGEITALNGQKLEVAGACVRPDQADAAAAQFGCPIFDSIDALLDAGLDIVAVANENDLRMDGIVPALERGCDLVVDKPLCIRLEDQGRIEALLSEQSEEKLLMLLTLRGTPVYMGLQQAVSSGRIGEPVFTHVRMAVRLKREERPPWFLDSRRSGGLFLDLLIHGLDALEWITGRRVLSMVAQTGNLDNADDPEIRDHASVYCRMDNGSTAIVEGQRMLPDSKGSDYRVHVAGTQGYADLDLVSGSLHVTDPDGADAAVNVLPDPISVVADWLDGGDVVPQSASLRANRLALLATASAEDDSPREVPA